jgi:hypothetical protein
MYGQEITIVNELTFSKPKIDKVLENSVDNSSTTIISTH